MTFAYPLGLLGLLGLPVVLALHLFRERRRRAAVSHLGLWNFLEAEVRGSRPRRIPITLLLLLDLLIALLLALAWARPQLALALPPQRARHLVILLDVSTSMLAQDAAPTRFAQAQGRAAELLQGLPPGGAATLVTFGTGAQVIADTRQSGLQETLAALDALQAGETGGDLRAALALGLARRDPDLPLEFHVLTDRSLADYRLAEEAPFPHPLRWHFFGGEADNQALVDLSVRLLPEGGMQVLARAANYAGQTAGRRLLLELDGDAVEEAALSIPPRSAAAQVWSLDRQAEVVSVRLAGSDALPADDQAWRPTRSGGGAQVLLVADDPQPLQRALEALPGISLRVVSPEDYSPSTPAGLTVLRGFLPERLPAGRVLVFDPPSTARAVEPGTPLQFPVPDERLAGVDFNGVRWERAYELPPSLAGLTPLVLAGGQPLLAAGQAGSSQVVAVLADLGRGNFTRHPAFPVLVANLVFAPGQGLLPETLYTGQPLPLPAEAQAPLLRLTPAGAGSTVTGAQSVTFNSGRPAQWDDTLQPGVYTLTIDGLPGGPVTQQVGVNAGAAVESDLQARPWTGSVQGDAGGRGGVLPGGEGESQERTLDLSPLLLGLALFIFLWEAWLAWRP